MARVLSPTRLRANLYRLLDEVLETGVPIEIERDGRRLRIVPVESASRLAALAPEPDYLPGDPEDIVHLDWSGEWRP
ncbi:MAG: type II toxin-antitoxin system Phd/YefM family antitoxin [Gemmatimonadales bacterium]|nr:MAG: type II toxin-antitoxin system Phd/YefM family antitoxin [Gemmatimonadales bacterium]